MKKFEFYIVTKCRDSECVVIETSCSYILYPWDQRNLGNGSFSLSGLYFTHLSYLDQKGFICWQSQLTTPQWRRGKWRIVSVEGETEDFDLWGIPFYFQKIITSANYKFMGFCLYWRSWEIFQAQQMYSVKYSSLFYWVALKIFNKYARKKNSSVEMFYWSIKDDQPYQESKPFHRRNL